MRFQLLSAAVVVTFCAAASSAQQTAVASQAMRISLPSGAICFDFGETRPFRGFKAVPARRPPDPSDYAFTRGDDLADGGSDWPDPLSGSFVYSPAGSLIEFSAKVAPGEYDAWLVAGRVITPSAAGSFTLRINNAVLHDQTPSAADLDGRDYLHRFMRTQYSQRPHALWHDYVAQMYPAWTAHIRADKGLVTVRAQNFFLSALILLPAGRKSQFDAMASAIEEARIAEFERTLATVNRSRGDTRPSDGPYFVYIPDDWRDIKPWTVPTDEERARAEVRIAGAPGQRVLYAIAVVPFEDLGFCHLVPSNLGDPGGALIPSQAVTGWFLNYRFDGVTVGEMALLPTLRAKMEEGVTQTCWLVLDIPSTARPGVYRGTYSFNPAHAPSEYIPVTLEVYPFRLAEVPAAFGIDYTARREPAFPDGAGDEALQVQLAWLRSIGFNSIALPAPSASGTSEAVHVGNDSTRRDVALETGSGRAGMANEALPNAPGFRALADLSNLAESTDAAALIGSHDVVLLRPSASAAPLAEQALAAGKTVWITHPRLDRLSFGFYLWRARARGRLGAVWSAPPSGAVGGYPGREWYNPFTTLDADFLNAPRHENPGCFLYKSAVLRAAEGITDYAYLVTLEAAIKRAESQGRNSAAAASARAFLSSLDDCLPPALDGYSPDSSESAKLDSASRLCSTWREEIAQHIIHLSQ